MLGYVGCLMAIYFSAVVSSAVTMSTAAAAQGRETKGPKSGGCVFMLDGSRNLPSSDLIIDRNFLVRSAEPLRML